MVINVPFFWFFSPFFICVNNPLRYLYDTNDANICIKIRTAKFLSKFLRPFTPLNERRFAPLPGAACEPAARGVKTASGALWSTKSGIFATLWSDAAASRSALRSETTTRQAVPESAAAANYIPIYYYISPKIWAWKEYRIKNIKRDISELFSILPFEIDFFRKHQYVVHYVGNPCVDSVSTFPIIAVLPGSRKQEIKDNLKRMLAVMDKFPLYQFVIAGAPNIPLSFYEKHTSGNVKILFGKTYCLLKHAHAALVTSGTATLETALFRVPQVVCYYTACGKIVSFLRRCILRVKFISLVNLIADKQVVTELVADGMTVANVRSELCKIVEGGEQRERMLNDYDRLIQILGEPGASKRAASIMIKLLRKN